MTTTTVTITVTMGGISVQDALDIFAAGRANVEKKAGRKASMSRPAAGGALSCSGFGPAFCPAFFLHIFWYYEVSSALL
jgi:hypothetical protein